MDKIKRLPKGHRVICAMPLSFKKSADKYKITYTEDDNKIFIECFVSGDEPGEGLSIVSLDNPAWCLYCNTGDFTDRIYPSGHSAMSIRSEIAQGYYPSWCRGGLYPSDSSGAEPFCPY